MRKLLPAALAASAKEKLLTLYSPPAEFDRTPNHDLVVPQLSRPSGVFS